MGEGGGIYVVGGTAIIHNATVVENQSEHAGGGIYTGGSLDLVSTIVGRNNTIAGFNNSPALLGRADELMRRNGAGALGVIDDTGQLVGFLLRGRIKRAAASE